MQYTTLLLTSREYCGILSLGLACTSAHPSRLRTSHPREVHANPSPLVVTIESISLLFFIFHVTMRHMIGTLFIAATPIGNLSDITFRAIDVLKSVDMILCEDTRVTQKLLNHFEIKTPTMSYHQHSDDKKVREITALLESGKNLALVTDAGTPGISDPGNKLISDLRLRILDLQIVPIPGPSAVISALSISGFPTDKFLFLGFPPHKKGRNKFFQEVADAKYTVAFYESSHRITKAIAQLVGVLEPERNVCICRELTKKFETVYRGTMAEISEMAVSEKGEFVVVVGAR